MCNNSFNKRCSNFLYYMKFCTHLAYNFSYIWHITVFRFAVNLDLEKIGFYAFQSVLYIMYIIILYFYAYPFFT